MKEIPLTKGFVAQVDDEDFEWLNQWKWCYQHGYAARNDYSTGTKKMIYMHILIAQTPHGFDTDHHKGGGLINLRSNLKICTKSENQHNREKQINNTSGFKGVTWDKERNRWSAKISISNKVINLGRYSDPTEAARAYDAAALKYHGDFANTNFKKDVKYEA